MENKDYQKRTTKARQRSHIYGLLSIVYSQEVTPELLQRMKDSRLFEILSELNGRNEDEFLQEFTNEFLENLAVEYACLFLGPGKHISPHESIHHQREDGQWGQLWGQSTVDVKKFVETAGFYYESKYKGLPDHISVELEFMTHVTHREGLAWAENDEDRAQYCREIEKLFFDKHLINWVVIFCEKITSEVELSFYGDIALLTKSFIEFEKEELGRGESVSTGHAKEMGL
jgi:TorA maturation chaperone TorD